MKLPDLPVKYLADLERLDASAKERSLSAAGVQYAEALKDYDAFLKLIPKAS